jgi:4-alpha-glucanotransferase
MVDRAQRWGVVPEYWGYAGDLVHARPEAVDAAMAAMGANSDSPPRFVPRERPAGGCAPAPGRAWGWAVQLYALRSRNSWGIGDFADLRSFGRWARKEGATVTLLNPLGAQNPTLPYQASPYYSSSRRFLNTLFLNVDGVEGVELVAPGVEPLRNAAQDLNSVRLIDYDEVFRLKSAALELIFKAAPQPRGLDEWVAAEGDALRDFATFSALAERFGPAWRNWPAELRHPGGDAVASQQRELGDRVAFHRWLQFHLDRQLMHASKETGLIKDVPVGFASDGFDAWRWQDLIASGVRIGAPPDEFFRDGQDWGAPAFDPWKLAGARCEPFVDAVRSAAKHAAGVRLDHVMGLFRQFWIPSGMPATQGLYVHYPAKELLAALVGESRRAQTFVVGEDLGLVEPSVRRRLRGQGALSFRLLWFERADPAEWPHGAVAALTTHDLPTVAGIWNLTEPEPRLHGLRQRLIDVTHAPDGTPALDVAAAAYDVLARSRPRIALATLEDALVVDERPNVPGTTSEWPNWRLALPKPIEDIETDGGANRIAEVMRSARPVRTRRPMARRTLTA